MNGPPPRRSRRAGPVGVLVLLVLGGLGLLPSIQRALEPPAASGPLRARAASAAATEPTGAEPRAPLHGPTLPGTDGDRVVPNGSARVWHHGGRWWAVLPDPDTGAHHVWALSASAGPWVDTGTVVDERPFAAIEVAPVGDRLVVASTGSRDYAGHALRVTRFSWDPAAGRWERDPDFPVALTDGGAPGTRLAVTSAGQVWFGRLDGRRLVVGSTDLDGQGFEGFSAVPGAPQHVGGFDLVAQGERVRVVWRSEDDDVIGEAEPVAGGWQVHSHPVYGARGVGPMDAAPAPGPDGAVLVTFTTSLAERGRNDHDPSVLVVSLDGERDPRVAVAATNRDRLTHPRLVVDGDRHRVGVVAVGPLHAGAASDPAMLPSRVVVATWADLASLDFGSGAGRPLISGRGDPAAPLVPVGPVDDRSGSVVVAAMTTAGTWATAREGTGPVEDLSVGLGVDGDVDGGRVVVLVEDTFESSAPGSRAPSLWSTTGTVGASATVVDDGEGRSLQVAAGDRAQATACRPLPASDLGHLDVRASVRATGRGTASARLVTVRGDAGARVGVWLSPRGELEWVTPAGRSRTDRFVADGVQLTVTVSIDRSAALAAVEVVDPSGAVSSSGPIGIGPELTEGVDELCSSTAAGAPGASIRLAELRVDARPR